MAYTPKPAAPRPTRADSLKAITQPPAAPQKPKGPLGKIKEALKQPPKKGR